MTSPRRHPPWKRLLLALRRIRLLRTAWQDLRLGLFYLRSLPALVRWWRRRRSLEKPSGDLPAPAAERGEGLRLAFVVRHARIRELKLAHTAHHAGHQVTLLCETTQQPELWAELATVERGLDTPWQFLTALDGLAPDVVHLFAAYDNARLLPVLRFAQAPVIYDPYDCERGFLHQRFQFHALELAAERRAFAMADHVCSRSLEPRHLRRQYGYEMPATTFFPDYCWQEAPPRPPREPGAEPRVVYAGNVMPEDRFPPDEFAFAQYLEISRALTAQGIHFHIYPGHQPFHGDPRQYFSIYYEEAQKNPRFHFHESVPHAELLRLLPTFDAALHISGPGINDPLGRPTRAKMDHSTANKLFDCLEVDLPIIIHNWRLQRAQVRHYGTTIEVENLAELREALERCQPRKHRSKPTLAAHAHRLDRMYRRVAR